tara:strand:- start:462 stop:863 length:402 start_codon:yes stop_codon:yes gene_type:complete
MPRGKPTSIVEQRITLGTFERQWVVEQENYLKSQVTQAKISLVASAGATVIGAGAVGYGIYLAGGYIGAGLSQLDFKIPNPLTTIVQPIVKPIWDTIEVVNPFSTGPSATTKRAVLIAEFLTWAGIEPDIAKE